MGNSIYHSSVIYNRLIRLNLGQIFSSTVMNHILSILISVFLRGYRGKPLILPVPAPAIAPPLPISLTMENGRMQNWK